MSDNWVGPGWWMASDGKWYPPRTPDGRPVEGTEPLADAEREAEAAATRAERAATIPRRDRVSIKQPEADDVDVHEAEVDNDPAEVVASPSVIDLDQTIDLRESIDLRSTDQAEPLVSAAMAATVGGDVPNSPKAGHRPTMGMAEGSDLTVLPPVTTPATRSRSNGMVASIPDQGDNGPNDGDADPSTRDRLAGAAPDSPAPLQHAVLPAPIGVVPQGRSRNGPVLLALATALAIACGVLGALLLRERSEIADLRTELEQTNAANEIAEAELADVSELNDEVRTLTLQNEQLHAQLNDMSALVLELPEGRVTEIIVPFTPVFADEENGRFIAMSSAGEYVVWAEGAEGAITDSGQLSGSPTGLFAAARKAWVTTDADKIDIVSLTNEEGLPSVEFGPASFLAAEERAYWTYEENSGSVVRLRKGDGGITATVPVPVPVIDLTIGAGSVWALGENGRVYRINTADFTVQAIDAGVDLVSITAGPDALWTLSAADGSLRRVDAVTGEVLVTVPVGRDPIDATFAGSSVWVALRSGTSLIEVDTRTAAVISRTALPGTPTALHEGDSGVFVTLEGDVPLVRVASLTLPTADDDLEASGDISDEG